MEAEEVVSDVAQVDDVPFCAQNVAFCSLFHLPPSRNKAKALFSKKNLFTTISREDSDDQNSDE